MIYVHKFYIIYDRCVQFYIIYDRCANCSDTWPALNLSLLLQNILFLTTLTHFLLIARKRDLIALDLLTLYLASVRIEKRYEKKIDTWFNVVGCLWCACYKKAADLSFIFVYGFCLHNLSYIHCFNHDGSVSVYED